MTKYRILFNDEDDYEDGVFDTWEEANEHGMYLSSCGHLGSELLHMSNPGDYDDDFDDEYEIVEIDE